MPHTSANPDKQTNGTPVEPGIPSKRDEWIDAILPWGISLSAHLVLFLIMFLIVYVEHIRKIEEPLTASRVSLSDYLRDPMDSAPVELDFSKTAEAYEIVRTVAQPSRLDLLEEVASEANADIPIIGIGAGVGDQELPGIGLSMGSLGEGPSFFGLGRGELNAQRICYVIDRSGSMSEELDYVKDEVIRSINRLHRVQQFHIIFFSAGRPIESPPEKFVHAIQQYKTRAIEFLSTIRAGGGTNPVPAMSRAFQHEADLIYFLTDGEFHPELVTKLREWNSEKKVRIYTIAFLRKEGEDLLRQIARENGGDYTFVAEHELH